MLIKVRVSPSAKAEEIIKKSKDSFEVKVKEKPQQGMANKAVLSLLSYYFEIPRHKIRLIKGAKGKNKIFEIIE